MVQDILQDAVTCVMDVTFQKIVEKSYAPKKDGRADYDYSFKGWFL